MNAWHNLIPTQDQANDVLGKKSERAQVEYFRSYGCNETEEDEKMEQFKAFHLLTVFIHKLEDLLNQWFGALEVDVTLGWAQEGANCIHRDASLLNKSVTGSLQFLKPVVIGSVHHAQKGSRLQSHASRVRVLNHLTKHILRGETKG